MRKKFILPLICGLFSFCSIISYAQKADIIFVNGKIFTADSTRPWASSLAIKGNKILAVGGPEIESLKDAHTRLIDLEGKTVIPGFNDAHYHHNPYYQGFYAFYPSDGSDISWNQLKDSIQALARRTPPGSFLFDHGHRSGHRYQHYPLCIGFPDS
ncbi:MAG: amidohydrolase family protein [Flavisolibacter sp.]